MAVLGRFGAYLARTYRGQFGVSRGPGAIFLSGATERAVVTAAEKLSQGRAIYSPKETMDMCLRLYAPIFPTRFSYYNHLYLTIGNGYQWVHGGLLCGDASYLDTEFLESQRIAREEEDVLRTRKLIELARLRGDTSQLPRPHREIFLSYANGTWPDKAPPHPEDSLPTLEPVNQLYPPTQYARLALLAYGDFRADPEWVEDARFATKFLLTHGVERKHVPGTHELIIEWALRLEKRYGGSWLP